MAWRDLNRRACALAGGVFLVVSAVLAAWLWRHRSEDRLLARAKQALADKELQRALALASSVLEFRPDSREGAKLAAEAADRLGLDEKAIGYLRRLEESGALEPVECLRMGNLYLRRGHPSPAEEYFRRALEKNPDLHEARHRLVHLLSIECRTNEALAQRQHLLRHRIWSTEDLLYLAKPDDLMESPDLDVFLKAEPTNPALLVAKGRQARLLHRFDEAQRWLDRALVAQPEFVAAHADRGLLLLERHAVEADFAQWERNLPAGADDLAEIWLVRGMGAKGCHDIEGAVRCFGEALERAPDHQFVTYQLSQALAELGQDSLASVLASRTARLDELARAVDDVYDTSAAIAHLLRVAGLLESLGRLHEAAAWYDTIGRTHGDTKARAKAQELFTRLGPDAPIVALESDPLREFPLEQYARPSFQMAREAPPMTLMNEGNSIQFRDVAPACGLDFAFIGAAKAVRRPRRIFEIFGGGLAIVDFDLDGWPDVYAAQGSAEREDRDNGNMLDQLYWNRGGTRFERVTASANLTEDRFSQGVSAGDFNNDGFPDLFVANVGENRLFQNNGDGTFSDVTSQAGIAGAAWTSSCAIADLNGDSWPDLVEVNYLGGREIHFVLCDDPRSRSGQSCRPRDFPSEPDRFFLNLGDGRFSEKTAQTGFVAPDGKGLGLVVADFDGKGQLDIFVANDTTANHYYCNQSPRGSMPQFENRADLAGLAVDRNGMTQACMGIAIDDVDGDTDLDLFVTNFFEESNTLYRRVDAQFFEDASRTTGLYEPSLSMLGFGTQFLDADLDGDPDLVVANGHIASEARDGSEYQMHPQLFENQGGNFIERRDAGPYFDRKLLGRAVARLDFDRDGREDVAITHLDAPLALLQNNTPHPGNYLSVRLIGTTCDRDAIGSTVTVTTSADRTRVRQLTAGDGYYCTNQRLLVFGLGDATQVSRLVIRWPSGTERQFVDVPVNQELTIVE